MFFLLSGCSGLICKTDEPCVYRNNFIKKFVYAEFTKEKDGLRLELFSSLNRLDVVYDYKTIDFMIDGKKYSHVCSSSLHIGYGDNMKEINSVFLDKKFVNLIVNSKKCKFKLLGKESYISKSDKEGMNLLLTKF